MNLRTRAMLAVTLLLLLFMTAMIWTDTNKAGPRPNSGAALSAR